MSVYPRESQKVNIIQDKNAPSGKLAQSDMVILESKRLLKQGYYKKVYVMLQQHLTKFPNIESVDKMKIYRRLIASTVHICSKHIKKPENPNKFEKFQKLLQAGLNHLNHWQIAISNYMVKTCPKFEHLQGFLEEISDSSSEDSQSINDSQSRRSTHRDSTKMTTPLLGSPSKHLSKHDKQASLLVQILKNQENRDGSSENILNNSFNDVEGSNIVIEEFTGNEINTNHQMDEFFGYCVRHLMNYGLFYRKYQKYQLSFRYFDYCYNLTKKVENTLNPSLLNICANAKIPFGALYLEFKRYKEAIEIFESALDTFQIELSVRFNKNIETRNSELFTKKVRKTVKLMCITLLNIAKCHELQFNYARTLESYKLTHWFSKHFLTPDDEFYRFIYKAYHKIKDLYGTHIQEVTAMERVVFEGKEIAHRARPQEEKSQNKTHFLKLQDQLYKKFGCSELNKRQIPVKLFQSPMFAKRNQKDQLFDHKLDDQHDFVEKTVDVSKNPIRELMNSAVFGESPTKLGDSANPYLNLLEDFRRRKEKKLPKKPVEKQIPESKKHIANQRFFMDPAKEKSKMEITAAQAEKCIQQLNRNIKFLRPKTATSSSFTSGKKDGHSTETPQYIDDQMIGIPKYVDIDQYFVSHVDGALDVIEEEKAKPQDFSQVVRNHLYHCKRDVFDKKDWQYRRKTINFSRQEDLGDEKTNFKEFFFGGFVKEKKAIETDGFFITTQTQGKNTIQTRINTSKSLSTQTSQKTFGGRKSIPSFRFVSPIHKKRILKFADEQESPKIDDQHQHNKKVSLTSLILKHKDSLGLTKTVQAIKEMHKKSKAESFIRLSQGTLQDIEDKPEIAEQQPFDDQAWNGISVMVKDRITKLMEDVQHEIKDDAIIANRILSDKPIFQQKKSKKKFLKGVDELANSCKKSLDFVHLVRLQMKNKPDAERSRKGKRTVSAKTESDLSTKESKMREPTKSTNFKALFAAM